jgi:hypothetical protein
LLKGGRFVALASGLIQIAKHVKLTTEAVVVSVEQSVEQS